MRDELENIIFIYRETGFKMFSIHKNDNLKLFRVELKDFNLF